MVDQCYHQNVLYVVVKNQKFIKEQEAKGLLRVRSLVVSDLVVSDFRLPAMCRGELSTVIAQLMSRHL